MKTRFDIIHSIVGGAMSGTPDGIETRSAGFNS